MVRGERQLVQAIRIEHAVAIRKQHDRAAGLLHAPVARDSDPRMRLPYHSQVELPALTSNRRRSLRLAAIIYDQHFKLGRVALTSDASETPFQGDPVVVGGNDQAELGRTA